MSTISVLPLDKIRIVKKIIFEKNSGNRSATGEIIYARNLSPQYKMITTEQPEDIADFLGIPPNAYPEDCYDRFILNSVRSVFPDAVVRSELLLFDVEIANLKRLLQAKQRTICHIITMPTFEDLTLENYHLYEGKTYTQGNYSLDLFVDFGDRQLLDNEEFFYNYPAKYADQAQQFFNSCFQNIVKIDDAILA